MDTFIFHSRHLFGACLCVWFLFGSLSAVAFEDDGTWNPDIFYHTYTTSGTLYSTSGRGPTKSLACRDKGWWWIGDLNSSPYAGTGYTENKNGTNCVSVYNNNQSIAHQAYLTSKLCSAYPSEPRTGCGETPAQPDDHCEGKDGTAVTLNTRLDVSIGPDGQPAVEGDVLDQRVRADGCNYALQDTTKAFDVKIYEDAEGNVFALASNTYLYLNHTPNPEPNPLPTEDQGSTDGYTDKGLDTRVNTSDTTVSEPTLNTLPDGTTQETQTVETTDVAGSGVKVSSTTETVTVTQSEGIEKKTTTTTETTTNPDGSKVVNETTVNTYTAAPVTTYNITNNNGNVSVTAGKGTSTSSTTNTQSTYDSSGNLTGKSSTTTGDGSGEEPPEEGAFCDENPDVPDCKDYEGPADEGLYTDDTEKTFSSVLSAFKDQIQTTEIFLAATSFFNLTVGGSCPVWSVSVWVFDIVIDQQCSSVALDALSIAAVVLMSVAFVVAFRIAFL